jgi:hypothetical protein
MAIVVCKSDCEPALLRAIERAQRLAATTGDFAVVVRSGGEYHAAIEDALLDVWAGATVVASIDTDGQLLDLNC